MFSKCLIELCNFAKIVKVGNTAYKTGQRLPAAPFSQCNELLAFVLFQIGKVSHDVRCPEKAADVESFFRLLLKYVILVQVWKSYVIQCLPNVVAKNLRRAFWPLFGKPGQKSKGAFDKIDTVLLNSKGNEFEFECSFILSRRLLLVF